MQSLLIVQRIVPSYRLPVFEGISQLSSGPVTVFAGNASPGYGQGDLSKSKFTYVKANWKRLFGYLFFDPKVFSLWKNSNIICHIADYKFVSLWVILLLNLLPSKKTFIYGQGGYKKKGLPINILYSASLFFCDGYICYTDFSKRELMKKTPKFLHHKIKVCDNTLLVSPVEKILEKNIENSILHIGRLRSGCDIEILLNAAQGAGVKVKVIGIGDEGYIEELKRKFGSIATFYGGIFDEEKQKEIASSCIAGAFGGDAGLSAVHYMSLGLPVIVHNNLSKHMGPEPSYVVDGVNGLLFERNNLESLTQKIKLLSQDDSLRKELALNSLDTFNRLSSPSMSEKFCKIFGLLK